jgi:uncharacterized membrane protein YvbJ
MALINCPSCKTRISDKAKTCSQCGYNMQSGKTTDGLTQEQLQSKAKLARMKLRYSLQMQAMIGIILFLLGIVSWYFLGEKGLTEVSHFVELGTAFIGFVWYIITRVRLLAFKKS